MFKMAKYIADIYNNTTLRVTKILAAYDELEIKE